MKQDYYIVEITKLIEACQDLELLDLVLKILQKS